MLEPDNTDVAIRVLAALACGGMIGIDRELRSHDAGMRTHALAAEGAALFMLAGILLSSEAHQAGFAASDPTRIASTVAQGIGFLAAGVIFGLSTKVHGLTTAAGLWATAAIGLLCGAGFYFAAFFSTAATLLVLSGFKVIEAKLSGTAHRNQHKHQHPPPDA